MKALVALVMGALAIAAVNVVGILQGKAEMPTHVWILSAVVTLFCTLTFAALGVFVGYVVPGENAMQILGPGLALLSFLGGVFIPLDQYSDVGAPHRLLDPDVRRRRDRPLAAHPRAALVRRRQRGRLVRDLRGRRRVADEQGHGPGREVATVTAMSSTPVDADRPTGPRRWGLMFAAIWLFYLLSPLAAAWDRRDRARLDRDRGHPACSLRST